MSYLLNSKRAVFLIVCHEEDDDNSWRFIISLHCGLKTDDLVLHWVLVLHFFPSLMQINSFQDILPGSLTLFAISLN